MKVDLKEYKENSKFDSSWESNKESRQGEEKFKGWNTCKALIVLEEIRAEARGARALATWAYSPACPKARLCLNWCDESKTKTKGVPRERVSTKEALN